jgi:hypothetical protein
MDSRLHRGMKLSRWNQLGLIVIFAAGMLGVACPHGVAQTLEKPRPGPACVPVASLVGTTASADHSAPDAEQSSQAAPVNREVCVAAHVYQVIELEDGTRFLDVCPAAVPDADCRFVLLSLPIDREEVGDLKRLGGLDIQLRGTLRRMHGRVGIYLSHARQLEGGPEKFRPNPKLLREFSGESDRMGVRDPNLRSSGHHRSFMNRELREAVPSKP